MLRQIQTELSSVLSQDYSNNHLPAPRYRNRPTPSVLGDELCHRPLPGRARKKRRSDSGRSLKPHTLLTRDLHSRVQHGSVQILSSFESKPSRRWSARRYPAASKFSGREHCQRHGLRTDLGAQHSSHVPLYDQRPLSTLPSVFAVFLLLTFVSFIINRPLVSCVTRDADSLCVNCCSPGCPCESETKPSAG